MTTIKKNPYFSKQRNSAGNHVVLYICDTLYSAQAFVALDWEGDVDAFEHVEPQRSTDRPSAQAESKTKCYLWAADAII